MKVIYIVRNVQTTKNSITITKIDTMKRKEKDMKKMKHIEKRNWNKNTILIQKPLPVLFVIVQ